MVNDSAPIDHGKQPAGLDAQLQIRELQDDGSLGEANDSDWGETNKYGYGTQLNVDEKVQLSGEYQSCELTGQEVTKVDGQTPSFTDAEGQTVTGPIDISVDAGGFSGYATLIDKNSTSVEITNTVSCTTATLELEKTVENGSLSDAPDTWTLTATPPQDSDAETITGKGSVSGTVEADTAYTLAESGGPATYVQHGDWTCRTATAVGEDGTPSAWGEPFAPTDNQVKVPTGKHTKCTVTNATASLTLLKHVDNANGANQQASDFQLSLTPDEGVAGLAGNSFAGAEAPSAANTTEVRPDHPYAVSEELGEYAYLQVQVQEYVGTHPDNPDHGDASAWRDIDPDQVRVAVGENKIIRIVNRDAPTVALPLTGGIGTAGFQLIGGGILAFAIAAGVWKQLEARRKARAH